MNKEMMWGTTRHFITLIATAILVGKTNSIDTAIIDLVQKISSGDVASITSAVLIVFAILWSIWAKASEATKENVVKTLTFRK